MNNTHDVEEILQEKSKILHTTKYENPDDVLDEIGDNNSYILYIYYAMSISWAITSMPMMVSAFLLEEDSNNTFSSIVQEFELIDEKSHLVSWIASSFMLGNMVGGCTLTCQHPNVLDHEIFSRRFF
uniref:Uncharacterized protein n=1 Tax=Acrobeloides nanus TaxID=290746 RepID=A0A914C903_9BILA